MKSPDPEAFPVGWQPLQEVATMLANGITVWVECPRSFDPSPAESRRLLSFQSGDLLRINKLGDVQKDGTRWLLAQAAGPDRPQKWVLSDVLCLFAVKEGFVPAKDWPHQEAYLTLRRGERVRLTQRKEFDWTGWGKGLLRSGPGSQEGLFPLYCVEERLFVSRCCRPNSNANPMAM
mmetsp:Transcript_72682/g.170307  ORF Transcript_72682/g.170307 Transcript_72682/m.170307 type:complete len:177 (+) Transcript_72682:2-532(+)